LVEGDTIAEVVDYIVARYGEYVLLRPNTEGANILLWLAGPALALLGLGLSVGYIRSQSRRRAAGDGATKLSEEEEARLREILRD
ncbi:MAG: cytochrome c-type biogenesis protein CcmH, partial [Nioella sp.]